MLNEQRNREQAMEASIVLIQTYDFFLPIPYGLFERTKKMRENELISLHK